MKIISRKKYNSNKNIFIIISFFLGLQGYFVKPSQAGVFQIPHFISQNQSSIGIEPEVFFSYLTSIGINVKYTHGLSDWSNLTGIIGTRSGSRQFRIGGAWTFDIFPDIEKQPGIGIALQGLLIQRASNTWGTEWLAIPYIHKTFHLEKIGIPIEPFFAIPTGLSLYQGQYTWIINFSAGALFQHNEHFKTVVELGVGITNSHSYLSGGMIYSY